jgi:hypothetical protein
LDKDYRVGSKVEENLIFDNKEDYIDYENASVGSIEVSTQEFSHGQQSMVE